MAEETVVRIEFQYLRPGAARPVDAVQEEELVFRAPLQTPIAAVPIPAVGDSVALTLEVSGRKAYKVVTRHFSYTETPVGLYVVVNIVVSDLKLEELGARLKE